MTTGATELPLRTLRRCAIVECLVAAQERGLSKNDLVAYLLAHALDRLDDGALEVPVRPNTFAILREPA